MYYKFFFKSLIIYFIGFIYPLKNPSLANTILKCTGSIPNKSSCLIKANTYKINVNRIDICQKDPFPSFRITPDYSGSNCINLFDIKKDSVKFSLRRNSKFNIPNIDNFTNTKGVYQYISMILKNEFIVSGKYTVAGKTYKTGSKGPRNIKIDNKTDSKPQNLTERLTNWRGINNKDNPYCINGGTSSRCDLAYNGYKLTAIGLNDDFIETSGDNTKYIFYVSNLQIPINLQKDSTGYLDIKPIKNLEVYGNGKTVKSISTAPFLFQSTFIKN